MSNLGVYMLGEKKINRLPTNKELFYCNFVLSTELIPYIGHHKEFKC